MINKINDPENKIKILEEENDKIKNKNQELENEISKLKEKLKLYTNDARHKKYYTKNSDKVKERATEYKKKLKETNPEKIKEWAHNAYINRKEKIKKQNEQKEQNKN